MIKKVVYTTIFGGYDDLVEPHYIPDGWDFICFTDDSNLKSDAWKIVKTKTFYNDNTRNAKQFKVLPHRHLSDYDYSIFIDGNMTIRNNPDELIDNYLNSSNIAFFNHNKNLLDPRDCIYKEAEVIFEFGKRNGNYKDNPELIKSQMQTYQDEGYPKNNGLITGMVILRKHNEKDCIVMMEDWWTEIKYHSRRDQLSFNYVAWENKIDFSYLPGDSRNNKWFVSLGKHTGKNKKVEEQYEPISFKYFLDMEFAGGTGGKEIITQNQTLKTVRDVYMFYSIPGNVQTVKDKLIPDNWQYFNCILAEFRKGVGDHHKLGWDRMTEEYYYNLELMNDDELETFLKENPVEFDNGLIKHSYHRACAMIGRLIKGKKYIPFYMKKSQIYDEPRKHDGKHRIKSSIQNIRGLSDIPIPAEEFTICQSGILALMGIRQNDDVDIIISTEARNQIFSGDTKFIRSNGVEIFEQNKGKFKIFDAQGDDDLIENYSFKVNGYNFLEPRFYFSRKNKHTDRDKSDWKGMRKFFEMESHLGYPFNQLTEQQWGVKYCENI